MKSNEIISLECGLPNPIYQIFGNILKFILLTYNKRERKELKKLSPSLGLNPKLTYKQAHNSHSSRPKLKFSWMNCFECVVIGVMNIHIPL